MRFLSLIVFLLPVIGFAQSNLPDAPHVYVQGMASVTLEPELLILSGQISARDREVTVASQQVEDQSAELVGLLQRLNVEREDVRASMPRVEQVFEHRDGGSVFVGYRVRRDIEIRLSNMERYHLDYAEIIRADALASVRGRFSVRDPEAAINEAQLAAVDDAHARAKRLTEQAGAELGPIHSMTEFDLRGMEQRMLVPARSFSESTLGQGSAGIYLRAAVSDSAPPLFEPEALTASATVFVVYLLKP